MSALAVVDATPGLGAYMAEIEARLAQAVRARPGLAAEVANEALAAGGKRLRPLLCFLTSADAEPRPAPGVAVELVHLATLMRDAGFAEVRYRLLAGSIVALHTGEAV